MNRPAQNIAGGGQAQVAAMHGLLAEFPGATSLLAAARRVRDAGYVKWA